MCLVRRLFCLVISTGQEYGDGTGDGTVAVSRLY
jgi:hypothetical protein